MAQSSFLARCRVFHVEFSRCDQLHCVQDLGEVVECGEGDILRFAVVDKLWFSCQHKQVILIGVRHKSRAVGRGGRTLASLRKKQVGLSGGGQIRYTVSRVEENWPLAFRQGGVRPNLNRLVVSERAACCQRLNESRAAAQEALPCCGRRGSGTYLSS